MSLYRRNKNVTCRLLLGVTAVFCLFAAWSTPLDAEITVSDHIWSNGSETVIWGQGVWTRDGNVVGITHPGGKIHPGDGRNHHDWDNAKLDAEPNDFHFTVGLPDRNPPWVIDVWVFWALGPIDFTFQMFVANNFENVTAEIHVDQDTLLLKDQNNQILYDGPYSTFDPGSLPFGGQFTPQSRRIENPGKVFLYDNGPANGTNGYSNATDVPFGSFRYLLDDFNVPEGESWSITDFHWRHIWTTIPDGVGPGTGILLEFWPDGGNCTPVDAPLATANVTSYTEVTTGNVFFSRNEKESSVEFDKIKLPPGHYWFHATIIGPENNFWLTANQNKCECWVDYADFAGLISGTAQFGVASDLSWQITGRVQPLGGCIPPDTYTVFRGIVLPPPPTLQTFADEDGEVACYNPGFTINDQEAPVTLDFEATNSDAIDGTVSVTSTAGTPGIGVRALCWQWPNGPFVQVGEQWDETFNSIAKHEFGPVPPGCVEQNTGRVRWRLEWRKKGFTINFPWKVTVDATGVCAR